MTGNNQYYLHVPNLKIKKVLRFTIKRHGLLIFNLKRDIQFPCHQFTVRYIRISKTLKLSYIHNITHYECTL